MTNGNKEKLIYLLPFSVSDIEDDENDDDDEHKEENHGYDEERAGCCWCAVG